MLLPRIFPTILLNGTGAIKTINFDAPKYIGDPINTARIFNANEVDELALLDINASAEKRTISLDIISQISDECFMPLTVGGGINSISGIRNAINAGAEKIAVNSYAVQNPMFVRQAADEFGSSTIVVSLDARKIGEKGHEVFIMNGKVPTKLSPARLAETMQEMGAGEIIINSIDRDGTMAGYDLELIEAVSRSVDIPIIACGGAGNLDHMRSAIYEGGASAATAGSMFVYQGRKRAVLINFPTRKEIEEALFREVS